MDVGTCSINFQDITLTINYYMPFDTLDLLKSIDPLD